MIPRVGPITNCSDLMQSVNWRQCRGRALSHKVSSGRSTQLRIKAIIAKFIAGASSRCRPRGQAISSIGLRRAINCLIIVNADPPANHPPPLRPIICDSSAVRAVLVYVSAIYFAHFFYFYRHLYYTRRVIRYFYDTIFERIYVIK